MDMVQHTASPETFWYSLLQQNLNQIFEPQSLTSNVILKETCLKVMVIGNRVPESSIVVEKVKQELSNFTVAQGTSIDIESIQVYGKQENEPLPDWQVELTLADCGVPTAQSPPYGEASETSLSKKSGTKRSLWGSVSKAVGSTTQSIMQASGNMVEATTEIAGSATKTVVSAGKNVTDVVSKASGTMLESTTGMAGSASKTVVDASKTVLNTSTGIASSATKTVSQAGSSIVSTTIATTVNAANSVSHATNQTTGFMGQMVEQVGDNPALKHLIKPLKADWLLDIISQVNVLDAEQVVQDLQQKYPEDSPNNLTHRVIQNKVLYVAGVGFVSSLAPRLAAEFMALDLAGTVAIQAEMVYQIAAAYDMDLQEPSRKGELLAIFGAAFGTDYVAKLGLKAVLHDIPMAGAVLGASTNAIALYAVGYAACRFYEAQGKALESEDAAQAALEAGKDYLEEAAGQQILMDEILAHMIQASHPQKPWEQILPELESLHFPPDSLNVIKKNIHNPVPLDQLLQSINQDYGVAVLAQCQQIAEQDGVITPEEAVILEKIRSTLGQWELGLGDF